MAKNCYSGFGNAIGFLMLLLATGLYGMDFVSAVGGEVLVGQAAPEGFAGVFSSGDALVKEDVDGRYVLAVYWSLDGDKNEQLKSGLKIIRSLYSNRDNFKIISVCTDDDWGRWMDFLDKSEPLDKGSTTKIYRDHISWHTFILSYNPPERLYDEKKLPAIHLIGKDGKFRAVRIPLEKLEATVKEHVQVLP